MVAPCQPMTADTPRQEFAVDASPAKAAPVAHYARDDKVEGRLAVTGALPMAQRTGSRQAGASWPTVLLVALVCVAAAAAIALLLSWKPGPDSLSPVRADPGTITITRQPYDDSRDVELVVTQGPAAKLLATSAGIVTWSICRPGAVVTSGKPVATIGDRRVVPLATAVPPYRAISVGTSGDDVAALRTELARLGAIPAGAPPLAPADAALITAARLLAGLGVTSAATPAAATLPPGTFAWAPSATATVATCDVSVGSTVSAGAPLFTLSPPVTELAVTASPADAIPGPRVLTVAPVTVEVTDGRITSAEDLARLVATPAWAAYEQTAGKVPIRGQWKLKTPISVASLPAASLVTSGAGNAASDRACVSASGRPVPVTIVASSLGRTLVTFTGTWPDAVDTTPAEALRCG